MKPFEERFDHVVGNIYRCKKCGHPQKKQACPKHECAEKVVKRRRIKQLTAGQFEFLASH